MLIIFQLFLKLADNINIKIIEKSIRNVIERHEILRTIIIEDENGNSYQKLINYEMEEFIIENKIYNKENDLKEDILNTVIMFSI